MLRFKALRRFWGGKLLSDVTGDSCREYVAFRRAENEQKKRDAWLAKAATGRKMPEFKVSDGAARRELEDFRAAINHHRREGLHDKIVSVRLPPAGKRRERWLTRSEAAHLILTTWRYREQQNFRGTDRHTRRHVARFMVVARYMGSRASVICEASIEKRRPKDRAWIDLRQGVFYGLPETGQETNKRRQVVRVPPALLAHLRRWQAAGQRYPVEWNGEPVRRISKAHAAAVREAGFGPDVTPHTWRHTLATWLAQTDINDKDAADYLAMTVETFQRVYRHQRPDFSASVHRALNEKRTA